MPDTIESLQQAYSDVSSRIAVLRNNYSNNMATAEKIHEIYNELNSEKRKLSDLKSALRNYKERNYSNWKGHLWKAEYKQSVSEIQTAYDEMIRNMDANMDALNNEAAHYENIAYSQLGPIGDCVAALNTLGTQIENFVN